MANIPRAGAYEYLKTQAAARLYLDNIPNIQSSWVTQGLKVGQLALFFGANDMGSLMIEENVVASAGTVHYLTLEQIKNAIREAGYSPRQRNVFYQLIDDDPGGVSAETGERGCVSAPSQDETNPNTRSKSFERIPVFMTPDS
jgi:cyclic dehypoxanthinyl futalosine synthase